MAVGDGINDHLLRVLNAVAINKLVENTQRLASGDLAARVDKSVLNRFEEISYTTFHHVYYKHMSISRVAHFPLN